MNNSNYGTADLAPIVCLIDRVKKGETVKRKVVTLVVAVRSMLCFRLSAWSAGSRSGDGVRPRRGLGHTIPFDQVRLFSELGSRNR